MKCRKILAGILAFTIIGGIVPFSNTIAENININANAEDTDNTDVKTDGLFTYEINTISGDNQITITECDTSAEGVVDIPNKIDGMPVTQVEAGTFMNCLNITEINVPANVTYLSIATENIKTEGSSLLENINVDENNQMYCSEDGVLFDKDKTVLKKYPPAHKGETYTIPDSVTDITTAFFGNQYLESITISPNIETISMGAFYGCENLKSVTIEYGVQNIAELAFAGCTGLTEIEIPSTVNNIYGGAFSECTSLEKVVMNEGVRCIQGGGWFSEAFEGCTNLKDITFPESLVYIARNAFKDTAWLENQPDGMIYINNIAYKYKGEYNGDGEFKIKDGTTGISGGAFEDVNGIKSIIVPETVAELDGEEFIYCSDLTSITILNPECVIYYILVDDNTFPDIDYPSIYHGTIYGYEGSTAQEYAKEQENEFILLGSAEVSEIKGDANLDGEISIADVAAISAYIGNPEKNPLDQQSILNADVHNTGDGLTANDALAIQQYLAGIITSF